MDKTFKMAHINNKIGLSVLLAFVSFAYFISSANLTCSNDGSHFALASAIVEEGRVEIYNFLGYTRMVDYCLKDGAYYSDRPPGLALMSLPFYAAGKFIREMKIARFFTGRENISEVFVMFLPNISGTAVVLLLFMFCVFFGFDYKTGILTSLICAFATPVWIESTRFFSHQLSMMLVFAAAYCAVTMKKIDHTSLRQVIRVSVLLALASIVEIQNILFSGAFLAYLLLSKKIGARDMRDKRVLLNLAIGILVFAAVYAMLFFYNFIAFERFTIKSNLYNPLFPEEKGLLTSLSGNVLTGIDRLFTNFLNSEVIFNWAKGIRNQTPGIFILAPIFLVSGAGFYYFFKERGKEALFFTLIIFTEVIVASVHKTVLTRHISAVIPFLFFPAAFLIRKALIDLRSGRGFMKRRLLILVIFLLACLSTARVFYVINTFWGRSLIVPFPYSGELRLYVFFYGVLITFCAAGKKMFRGRVY
jgi:hypothetical protein